jgi:2-amino-4-hydroxy-6-hydroxymethyldihydropteridine diphosphokinase
MNDAPSRIEVGLSLGANLGDRLGNMSEARHRVLALPGVELVAWSPLYETEPIDVDDAFRNEYFLNAVLVLSSAMDARKWLSAISEIEQAMGRVRGPDKNAPRPIDIDILYVGSACIDSGGLTVPHPRWAERRFVVQPLADVRPDLVLPGSGATVAEVLARLADCGRVTRFAETW